MSETNLNYIGPIPKLLTAEKRRVPWWKRIPTAALIVVVLPTSLAAIYYLVIASPRYVSETNFVVRAAGQPSVSSLGVVLQGVGLAPAQTDAFAVHEYITSRDALRQLGQRYDIDAILAPPGSDIFSRYPRPWESRNEEARYKGFQRFVDVGFDSTTGISTLRVEAFRPDEARALAESLLVSGEALVNRLNERSSADAVSQARVSQEQARSRLAEAQQQLTAFRNREQFIDPELTAREGSELIGALLADAAALRAERAQIAAQAPESPQLPALDSRISAFESQINAERSKLAGTSESLAPKLGQYQDLVLARELADRELVQATSALISAEQDARRQRLYLDRVTNPSLPDDASEPKRWRSILTVLLSSLLIYGGGWLIYAGVREHNQA
jgi:BexC/CtrB/KpsE family polysaccharide export inner-membrane protein